jgi:hypothetical protein
MIYEHGGPWWKDIDRTKVCICLSELSGSTTSCHLVTKQEELAKEIMNFTYEVSFIF